MQRQLLRLLGSRGGSFTYRFGVTDEDTERAGDKRTKEDLAERKREADEKVREMVKMGPGLIRIIPIVNPLKPGQEEVILTDSGRTILDSIGEVDKTLQYQLKNGVLTEVGKKFD